MTQAQPLIQTLPMTLGAPMSDGPSNPTAIEIPLQIELPNGQTLFAAVALGGLSFDGQRQIAERMAAAWNAFAGVATQEIQAPVKCLHQIAEPAAKGLDADSFAQTMSDWAHGDAEDAARYHWLREQHDKGDDSVTIFIGDEQHGPGHLDAQIDDAIAAQAKQGGA